MKQKKLLKKVPGIWIALILLYIVSVIIIPSSLSMSHISNLLQTASFLGLVAIGQTLVIITGGIDLSVTSTILATNIVFCMMMDGKAENAPKAFAMCLLLGIVIGVVNGTLITRFKVVPMICTLAVNQILYGIALLYTGGVPAGSVGAELGVLGTGKILTYIPVNFLIWLFATALIWFVCQKTPFGRKLYACGSNPTAAHVNGIHVESSVTVAYIISSVCAVMCGILLSCYVNMASFGLGNGYDMNSVAAAVVGGALLIGGAGSVINTAAGVLFLCQINSLTNVLGIPTGGQYVIRAAIIIIGVIATSGLLNVGKVFGHLVKPLSLKKEGTNDQPSTGTSGDK